MIPPLLDAHIRTARFWSQFLFVDEAAAAPWEPWEISFPLGVDVTPLRLSADATGYVSLALGERDQEVEVAWDDLAHWHPHLLRWSELDAICRRVDSVAPGSLHVGAPLLLLARFAPMVSESDVAHAVPLIAEAWRQLRVQSPEAETRLLQITDLRAAGVRWHLVPSLGWCLEQYEGAQEPRLYSLRVAGNTGFPWVAWRELTEAVNAA